LELSKIVLLANALCMLSPYTYYTHCTAAAPTTAAPTTAAPTTLEFAVRQDPVLFGQVQLPSTVTTDTIHSALLAMMPAATFVKVTEGTIAAGSTTDSATAAAGSSNRRLQDTAAVDASALQWHSFTASFTTAADSAR
jgi:hypothetical protein